MNGGSANSRWPAGRLDLADENSCGRPARPISPVKMPSAGRPICRFPRKSRWQAGPMASADSNAYGPAGRCPFLEQCSIGRRAEKISSVQLSLGRPAQDISTATMSIGRSAQHSFTANMSMGRSAMDIFRAQPASGRRTAITAHRHPGTGQVPDLEAQEALSPPTDAVRSGNGGLCEPREAPSRTATVMTTAQNTAPSVRL
jgi:hypothetical protein